MDWKGCWEKDNLPWHIEDAHSKFLLHLDKITEKKNKAKIFFPLCGKVVGVEYIELALKHPTLETNFDGVWDRGGLEAVDVDQRGKYTDVMKFVMKRGAGCVLEIADRSEEEGPPFNVSAVDITQLYDLKAPPEKVDYEPASEILKSMNVDGMIYYYYKIQS
ncbi:TPMT [Mytilus coruscus]|uniref:TPMT n=1 Tax=Mytilus coruscus TaxID=42192 RepID=A0A6J8A9Q0_MYTCO|nr:TPMT [Mytilus coruscus]